MSLSTNQFYIAAAAIVLICMFLGFAYSKWVSKNDYHLILILIGGFIGGILSILVWFFAVKKDLAGYAVAGSEVVSVPDYLSSMKTKLNL